MFTSRALTHRIAPYRPIPAHKPVIAVTGLCAGMGRYGAILWVKARDVNKAAAALGAM